MPKLDWVTALDRVFDVTDRALDRFRDKPRRRLDVVPEPKLPRDPFSTAAASAPAAPAPAPKEKPLGDAALPAQVFGRRTCMWSGRATKTLQDASVVARFVDLDDPEHRDLEARLIRETKSYRTPYVYLRGEYVGAFEALDELARLGLLEERVLPPEERGSPVRRRVRIEGPPRATGEPPSRDGDG